LCHHNATHSALSCTMPLSHYSLFFFSTAPSTTEFYTLSLHDALPICMVPCVLPISQSISSHVTTLGTQDYKKDSGRDLETWISRSEEHTSELQSRFDLVCRLLLEKKKIKQTIQR